MTLLGLRSELKIFIYKGGIGFLTYCQSKNALFILHMYICVFFGMFYIHIYVYIEMFSFLFFCLNCNFDFNKFNSNHIRHHMYDSDSILISI